MSKPDAPAAPDYAAAAQETAAGNMENLKFQTAANRPNAVTPFGNMTWTSDPTGQNWTQTTTLSPDMQASVDAQQRVQMNQSQLASDMQGQVRDRMQSGFISPNIDNYVGNTPKVSADFSGFAPTGPGVNSGYSGFNNPTGTANQSYANFDASGVPGVKNEFQGFNNTTGNANTNFSGLNTSGIPGVDLNAPQFSDANAQAGAQAAYKSATELIAPKMEQDMKKLDNQLRLQGLTPGTEAYNNAMQNAQRTQAQQINQIANQSVMTGNQMANQNYSSQLAGYNAGLGAQGQNFGQTVTGYQTTQDALRAQNEAQGQNFSQAFAGYGTTQDALRAQNEAQGQKFGQTATAQQFDQAATDRANAAQQQNFAQSFAGYGTTQEAIDRQNAAQAQGYGQQLGTYQTGQDAVANRNAAAQQAQQQGLQEYQARYQDAFANYNQPLNAMNAILSGQQVQNPQFQNLPSSTAGYVGGADMANAASMQGNWDSGVYSQKMGAYNAMVGAIGDMASSAIPLSDERVKENIKRVGETDAGLPIYKYNYKGQKMTQLGVIAQEAMKTQPDAVEEITSTNGRAYGDARLIEKYAGKKKGLLGVDYSKVA